jgi:hypothetical protein
MKQQISKAIVLAVSGLMLFSFAVKPGGEGYEIFVGNNLLVQQFGGKQELKSLRWSPSMANEEMIIRYYHCGKAGKGRVVTIKDIDDNTLKQFRFPDASTPAMSLQMKVITDLNSAKKAKRVKLYYSSAELPKGRMLTEIDY